MDYYVGNAGNINYSGRSKDESWPSLEYALSVPGVVAGGNRVIILNDTYLRGSHVLSNKQIDSGWFVIQPESKNGSLPVLSGSMVIANWENVNTNVYKTYIPEMVGKDMKGVYKDGHFINKGRYPKLSAPNGGFIVNDIDYAYLEQTEITSAEFSQLGFVDNEWNGAELVAKTRQWILDIAIVTAHSGSSITTERRTYGMLTGFGFFLQNHINCLTQDNEWYWKKDTGELFIYSSANPNLSSYEIAYHDHVLTITNCKNIIVDDIIVEKGRIGTTDFSGNTSCWFRNIVVRKSAQDACVGTNNWCFVDIRSEDSQNNGIDMRLNNCQTRNLTAKRTGLVAGMGGHGNGQYFSFQLRGENKLVEKPWVEDAGYAAVYWSGACTTVSQAHVDRFNITKDDGGGIYTFDSWEYLGSRVILSYVKNGVGNQQGVYNNPFDFKGKDRAYYSDGGSEKIKWAYNVGENCGEGFLMHQGNGMLWENDFVANKSENMRVSWDKSHNWGPEGERLSRNNIITKNRVFQVNDNCPNIDIWSQYSDAAQFGLIDGNTHISVMQSGQQAYGFMYRNEEAGTNIKHLGKRQLKNYYHGKNDRLRTFVRSAFETVTTIGANKFNNSGIDTTPTASNDFSIDPGDSSANFSISRYTSGVEGMAGGVLRALFGSPRSATDKGGITYKAITLEKGKYYKLEWKTRGTTYSSVVTIFRNYTSSTEIHMAKPFIVQPETVTDHTIFKAIETVTNARLLFRIPADYLEGYFDDIALYEVSVINRDWRDYVKTVINESAETKYMDTPGAGWVNHQGVSAPAQVRLGPGRAMVYLLKDVNLINDTGNMEDIVTEPGATSQLLEAETGVLGAEWRINSLDTPVNIQPTAYATSDPTPERIVTFTTETLESGIYKVWVKMQNFGGSGDAFFIRVDGGLWNVCNNISSVRDGLAFYWDAVWSGDSVNTKVSYNISSGTHTIQIGSRENCKIDKIYITKNGDTPTA